MPRIQDLYKQVELVYDDNNAKEVAWIQAHLAKVGNKVKFKDNDRTALVLIVYEVEYTLQQIEINRNNPLREATDI